MHRPARTAAILLTLTLLAACVGGDVRRKKAARTAEAPATILRAEEVVVTDEMEVDTMHRVVWRFTAGGRTYIDSLSPTFYLESERWKVCYDPADPTNSSIELADIACGRAP